ncbi:MAG TPA: FGGY family carbohydrate kinase [Geminicoccaceae bacterium]|nr:FGGY family carbohydrate kinase [Geminicoccaceae bacterium]
MLDVGRPEVRLLAIAPHGRLLSVRSAPNEVRRGDPYPSCDTEHIWRWMSAALADFGERFAIRAIVPTSYGSTAALIDPAELVLPILDYAADPPPEIADAYVEIAPWFEECCCPVNPASVTLGRQLFWLSREFPDHFAQAQWILPFAQYWAWGLCGVPACEVTSLGAQTQLWNPRAGALSSLAREQGWAEKFPPLRNAWDELGPLQFDLAGRCGLPPDVPVLCGIYASGASLARYFVAGLDDFTLISTGDWLVAYQPGLALERLEPLRDTAAIVDLLGRPVASARFMGGAEHAMIAGAYGRHAQPEVADAAALVAAGTMALPSFADVGGPFPGTSGLGRIVGAVPGPGRARAALASLYLALMTSACLDLLHSRGQVIVEGPFAEDRLFTALLAALRPGQRLAVSSERYGAGCGAALLWGWAGRTRPVPLELEPVRAPRIAGLARYERRWRAAAEAASGA